jgi:proline racemase
MTVIYMPLRLDVVDSHTAGEPTRCVLSGGPHLGSGPLSERLERLRAENDTYRRAILCEPRGSNVLVGALLVEPCDPTSAAGVIFFNNAGYLGMCGHGMIGLAATLAFLGRIELGEHQIETPVGQVNVRLHSGTCVTIRNVPSYRHRGGVVMGTDATDCVANLPVKKRKGHLAITDRYPSFVHHQLVELGYLKSAHSFVSDSVAFNVRRGRRGRF